MATPTAEKLTFNFASTYLASDGGTITQRTSTSTGTTTTLIATGLTEADDFWNGAMGWFDPATSTSALQGKFFHIRDFDAASDMLTLAQGLPATPAIGDTFRLILGGNYRGNVEGYGLTADGNLPELVTTSGSNITGLTIKKIGAACLEGTLSVFFDQSALTLQIKMDSQGYGATLDVSSDVTGEPVFLADENGYVTVDVTNASLPVGDATDTYTVTVPEDTFVPDYQGYETTSGKDRYRLLVLKNIDTVDDMASLIVWCDKPDGADTTVATAEVVTIAAGSASLTDASTHPSASYWLYNVDLDDLRYIQSRNGNIVTWADATGGLRGKTAQAWAATEVVIVYPDFDIGLDAASANQFENPTGETTAPSTVTFTGPYDTTTSLSVGALVSTDIYGVWYKETIMADNKPRAGLNFDILAQWQ